MAVSSSGSGAYSTFRALRLDNWLVNQLKAIGLTKPTDVQANCIPQILQGRDCFGCDKTGSGKTLAFALPIIQKLSEDPFGIFALVLTPTRELAFQISEQFKVLGKPIGLRVCLIIGGLNFVAQAKQLEQLPHVVISTPGRLSDHFLSYKTTYFNNLRFLVLDEADRLLEGFFNGMLMIIFKAISPKRQTLLFSATLTENLNELKTIASNNPFSWFNENRVVPTVMELDQRYVLCPLTVKDSYVVNVVKYFITAKPTSLVVIFTKSCKCCQVIAMMFKQLNIDCVAMHGQKPQKERLAALVNFKSSRTRLLIATDVASRGLDIPMVDLIINHNVPEVAKDYIHRVGRTARAGRGGMAITFVTQYDIHLLHAIETQINTNLKEYEVNEKGVLHMLRKVSIAKQQSVIKVDEMNYDEKMELCKIRKLIYEGKDPEKEIKKLQKLKKSKMSKRQRLE